MEQINFYTTLSCPFCLKMDFAVMLRNVKVPIEKEINIIWDDSGDTRENKLIEIFGNQVPLPCLVKDGEIKEAVLGVYANSADKFQLNLNDNLAVIDSLIKSDEEV